jgi:ribokinase
MKSATTRRRAVVVGSINVDHVVGVEHLPHPGETVLARAYDVHAGGKGANQAIALARARAAVTLVGRVGNDDDGRFALATLREAGVDTTHVEAIDGAPTGRAFIQVSGAGENMICVVGGANATLVPADLPADAIASAGVLVLQGEIPAPTSLAAARIAARGGARVVLNLAPWYPVPADALAEVSVLVVNEGEAGEQLRLSAADVRARPLDAVRRLAELGPDAVLTLGAHGVVWSAGGQVGRLAAHRVNVVDTTGAGDAFVGNLAAALLAGRGFAEAVAWANAAGALASTAHGAVPSLPRRKDTARLVDGALADPVPTLPVARRTPR